jgi:Phosphoribosyl-ATP pyrophosphohydrolase
MTEFDDVNRWHMVMNIYPFNGMKTENDSIDLIWTGRIRLITEELAELAKAVAVGNKTEIADGLADLTWVVLGTAVEFDVPFNDVWDEVKKSNYTKVGGKPDAGGKIIKPIGYKAPDIDSILRKKFNNETAGESPSPKIATRYSDTKICQSCGHLRKLHEIDEERSFRCLECGDYCKGWL